MARKALTPTEAFEFVGLAFPKVGELWFVGPYSSRGGVMYEVLRVPASLRAEAAPMVELRNTRTGKKLLLSISHWMLNHPGRSIKWGRVWSPGMLTRRVGT